MNEMNDYWSNDFFVQPRDRCLVNLLERAMVINFHDVCPGIINLLLSCTVSSAITYPDAQSCHHWATGELRQCDVTSVHIFRCFSLCQYILGFQLRWHAI